MDKKDFTHLLKTLGIIFKKKDKLINEVLSLDDQVVEVLDEFFNEHFTEDTR